jgi:hypothetical protein
MFRLYFAVVIFFAFILVWVTGADIPKCSAHPAHYELNEEAFIRDALNDAIQHYSLLLNPDYQAYRFSMYEAFYTDLNQDGENEYIVSGSIVGQSYYVIMAYYLESDVWKCQVLNRAVGGGITDIKVFDLDNDGFMEIYSVVQDRECRRSCKIFRYSMDYSTRLIEMFNYQSNGGLLSSHNFSIFRSKNSDKYSLRIDEVIYPETEDGDVQQTTYIYKIVKREFVLDKSIKGGTNL